MFGSMYGEMYSAHRIDDMYGDSNQMYEIVVSDVSGPNAAMIWLKDVPGPAEGTGSERTNYPCSELMVEAADAGNGGGYLHGHEYGSHVPVCPACTLLMAYLRMNERNETAEPTVH